MITVLKRYLIINYLKTTLNVLLIAISFGVILNLFEEIEYLKNSELGLSLPFLLTGLSVPNHMVNLFPFIIFISSVWFLVSLRTKGELITYKIFGYSNFSIARTLSLTAFLIGIFILIIINPITSAMIKKYEQIKSNYSKEVEHLITINKNGLWIKERRDDSIIIINAEKFVNENIYNLTIYELDGETNKINSRIEAESANISENNWKLKKVNIYQTKNLNKNNFVKLDEHLYFSTFDYDKITSLYKNLHTISFIELLLDFEKLKETGYDEGDIKLSFNNLISMPFFLFLMVFLASIFVMGSVNKLQAYKYVFLSIIVCVLVYYFKDLSIVMGKTNRIPIGLSTWVPIITLSILCSVGVLQINEK